MLKPQECGGVKGCDLAGSVGETPPPPCHQELKSPNPVLPLGFLNTASLVEGLSLSAGRFLRRGEKAGDLVNRTEMARLTTCSHPGYSHTSGPEAYQTCKIYVILPHNAH